MLNETMIQLGNQRSVIRELFEFGKLRAAEIGAENVFDFSIGNPSVAAPDCIPRTARQLFDELDPVLLHGYTSAQGNFHARTQIADSLNRRFSSAYHAENLYLTAGAAAALCCCLKGLCCPGEQDEVLVFAPYFPEYKIFIETAGAKMTLVPADTETFQINFDALKGALSPRTKAVIINSPNNPSGIVYTKETIRELASVLARSASVYGHPIYLISDEPYREIVFGDTFVPWIPDYYDNTLVCYSWSKSLSLPGERIGYVLVPDSAEDASLVYAAVAGAGRSLGYVNAPSLFQRICATCADKTADISVYETNKTLLVSALRDMGYSLIEPQGTFYLFPQTLISDDIRFCEKAKEFDLLIVPGSGFGCPGHTRISYCVPTERVKRSLSAFEQLAKQYRK